MGLVLLLFLRVFFLLATVGGSLLSLSTSRHNISLGSSLNPHTNPSWPSPSGYFAFGFYQKDDGFAVGVWLESRPEITVVWAAYPFDLAVTTNSTIELAEGGLLLLHTTNGEEINIIGAYMRLPTSAATSAAMLDSGNFVLYNQSGVIWQSFDYPSDTLLGGQKLFQGFPLASSVSSSRRSGCVLGVRSDGNFIAYALDGLGKPEYSYWSTSTFFNVDVSLMLDHNGSLYLLGDGVEHRLYFPSKSSRSGKSENAIFRATLEPDGNFVLYSHTFTSPSSNLTGMMTEWKALQNPCKAIGVCGFNSYCSNTGTGHDDIECRCFPGFQFIDSTRSGKFLGCYRNFTDEACSQGGLDLFYNITALDNIELGDFSYSVLNLSKEACRKSCLDDCNCWASLYANLSCKMLKVPIKYALLNKNISATVFIKTSSPNDHVKGPHKPLPALVNQEQSVLNERKKLVYILAITLGFLALMCTMMAFSSFFLYKVHAHRYQSISKSDDFGLIRGHFSLRSFTFDELQKATDGFKEVTSRNSFGEVYKGFISEEKKAISVKRLEIKFQGAGGFRAEISAIAQTHHRNLVRLLGFCIHGATKLLVYEFMSNGSLAELLFNAKKPLGWKDRVSVALDVARGILYLHEECEARIIHCNIEPCNILLDESWTAKITDFGLSKLLRPNQSGTLTGIRGTRGYQAPEWHKNTLISTKVDIYSFGVVLLEILCCTGNMEIDASCDDKRPLFTWVYRCFVAKELTRLIGVEEEVDIHMFEKMVKVGLLCIQDDPDSRPSIKNVILMLEGTTIVPNTPSPTPMI